MFLHCGFGAAGADIRGAWCRCRSLGPSEISESLVDQHLRFGVAGSVVGKAAEPPVISVPRCWGPPGLSKHQGCYGSSRRHWR